MKAVVVGTGFGLRVHVPALRAAGFEVAALVGTDAERTTRRAERAGIAIATTSLADALARTDTDVVTIATPPDSHCALALEAISAGKHVVCEKPMALSSAEGEHMTSAAAAAGVIAIVGHEFRWSPAIEATRQAVHDGRLGAVHTATMTRFYPILADAQAPAPSWWFDPARGGGWLRANGTHLLDQLRLWLGEFTEVAAEIYQGVPRAAGSADDGYVLRFRTAGGAVGVLQESAAVWGPPLEVTRVAGVRGAITVEGDDCRLATADGESTLSAAAAPVVVEGSRPWTGLEVENYSRLTGWLYAMLSGATPAGTARPATFADGLAVLRIIDAAEQSMRDGHLSAVPVASNEEVPR